MRIRFVTFVALLTTGAFTLIVGAQSAPSSAGPALEAAHKTALIDGDLPAAIRQYQAIAAEYAQTDRPAVATALVAIAECYEKLGKPDALELYRQVIDRYSDTGAPAATARAKLGLKDDGSQGLTTSQVWADKNTDSLGRVSPDGRYLTFTDWDSSDLAMRDLATGKSTRLTHNPPGKYDNYADFSVPSPDSKSIAYAWFDGTNYELCVIGRDGGSPRVLWNDDKFEQSRSVYPYGWSPDGREILAQIEGLRAAHTVRLVAFPAAGGAPRDIKKFVEGDLGEARFSRDGRFIAYDAATTVGGDAHDIFLMARDGTGETPIVQNAANDTLLDWLPSGEGILFLSDRDTTNSVWRIEVSGGRAQGDAVRVKADVGDFSGQGFTKGGDYYYSIRRREEEVLVAGIDPTTGILSGRAEPLATRFAGHKQQAVWSVDGNEIAYVQSPAVPGGKPVLAVQSMKTGSVRTLPVTVANFANPAWLPDGGFVVQGELDNVPGLFRIDSTTGAATRLGAPASTDGSGRQQRYPAVSPDGQRVYYTRAGGSRGVWVHDLKSDTDSQVTADQIRAIAISPDGRLLAVTPTAPGAVEPKSPPAQVIALDNQAHRPLAAELSPANVDSGLTWSADGRFVFFTRADPAGTALWRAPANGGAAIRTGLAVRGRIVRLSAHPDGRRLAVSTLSGAEEIWVMRNLGK